MSEEKLGNRPMCQATRGTRVWPYTKRCVLDEHHYGKNHVSTDGTEWEETHYETWFKLLWNECVSLLQDVDDTLFKKPLGPLAEMMHGIAEDQPQMFTPEPNPEFRAFDEPVGPGEQFTIKVIGK